MGCGCACVCVCDEDGGREIGCDGETRSMKPCMLSVFREVHGHWSSSCQQPLLFPHTGWHYIKYTHIHYLKILNMLKRHLESYFRVYCTFCPKRKKENKNCIICHELQGNLRKTFHTIKTKIQDPKGKKPQAPYTNHGLCLVVKASSTRKGFPLFPVGDSAGSKCSDVTASLWILAGVPSAPLSLLHAHYQGRTRPVW